MLGCELVKVNLLESVSILNLGPICPLIERGDLRADDKQISVWWMLPPA